MSLSRSKGIDNRRIGDAHQEKCDFDCDSTEDFAIPRNNLITIKITNENVNYPGASSIVDKSPNQHDVKTHHGEVSNVSDCKLEGNETGNDEANNRVVIANIMDQIVDAAVKVLATETTLVNLNSCIL